MAITKEHFQAVLSGAVKAGASDLHFKVGTPIILRINGTLQRVKGEPLVPGDTREIAELIVEGSNPPVDLNLLQEWDGSYSVSGMGRFRANLFKQRNTFAAIMRVIPFEIPTIDGLGLPPVLRDIAMEERGLILVTGATGSGKSSALAAMIDHVNENKNCHILTIEDPIEFMHRNKRASISQREIGFDTSNFRVALRAALRQDPDVILVGEMRDTETIDIALRASETGHVVMSTVHTTDAEKTIGRLIAVFPADEQPRVRLRIAENLKATISLRLLPRSDVRGRVAAAEIMRATKTIEEFIRDPAKTSQMRDIMMSSREHYGMQTFDQHLFDLMRAGVLDYKTARAGSTNPYDFDRAVLLESGGDIASEE
ncbi:MAG: PilT/PilU family type 4a pilus ATPase [Candidatus Schekmanbacteria bacterium]|nr:PilT/PilU family type 4a pilus ATPase [Candidatus Schekmanbacteria bacterium]